jgi:hyperosmotically inducible periplasmic protein
MKLIQTAVLAGVLATSSFAAASAPAPVRVESSTLDAQVRQAIQKLAYYGVFDDLAYSVDDKGVVTLSGQVRQYNVRNSAVSVVRGITGVTGVQDQIEVLPLSPFDDRIRLRAYNAIYGYPALSRYAINARPPIRILVKNGHLTVTGYVANELDRRLVENRLQGLGGTFSVTNTLALD